MSYAMTNHSLLVLCERISSQAVHNAPRAHRTSASEHFHQTGDTAVTRVLLVWGQVEQHIGLEKGSRGVVDGYELVIDERGDVVEGDLG